MFVLIIISLGKGEMDSNCKIKSIQSSSSIYSCNLQIYIIVEHMGMRVSKRSAMKRYEIYHLYSKGCDAQTRVSAEPHPD